MAKAYWDIPIPSWRSTHYHTHYWQFSWTCRAPNKCSVPGKEFLKKTNKQTNKKHTNTNTGKTHQVINRTSMHTTLALTYISTHPVSTENKGPITFSAILSKK